MLKLGENQWSIFRYSNCVFELGGKVAIGCHHGPAVVEHTPGSSSLVNHWLYRKDHARSQAWPAPGRSNVGHRRFFMQRTANTVASPFANNTVAAIFGMGLNGGANVA